MTRREALQRAAALSGWVLTPAVVGVLEGCQTGNDLTWAPQVLTAEQVRLVGQIAQRILPPTDTPGALDVGVDRFIDHMLKVGFTEEEQRSFLDQLDNFSRQDAYFVSDREATQDEKLLLLEQTHAEAQPPDSAEPPSFFRIIKQLTLLGYFTSEEVMTQQLNYRAVPGQYRACVPLANDPRLYVDNNV